jgi:hypothetical protein
VSYIGFDVGGEGFYPQFLSVQRRVACSCEIVLETSPMVDFPAKDRCLSSCSEAGHRNLVIVMRDTALHSYALVLYIYASAEIYG